MDHNEGINKLYGGILTLVLAAILLGIGMTVLGQLGNASRIDVAFVNDKINATNSSCVTLTNNHITTSTAAFINSSDGQVISNGCFLFDVPGTRTGSCVNIVPSTACNFYNYKNVNVSYTYGATTTASTAVDTSGTAVGGFATWFTIIVVIIAASIIISIVIRSFSKE